MAYELKDRLRVEIYFNDIEFPFDRVNNLDFIHICQSARLRLPMVHLRVIDTSEFFSKNNELVNGTKIRLTVQVPNSEVQKFDFIMNTAKRMEISTGTAYDIDGYLNLTKYWIGSQTQPLQGDSISVMKTIASACGIGLAKANVTEYYRYEQSDDSQWWFPRNKPYHAWMTDLALHYYNSSNYSIAFAISVDKDLLIQGINLPRVLMPSKRRAIRYPPDYSKPETLGVVDFAPKNSTGANSYQYAYGNTKIDGSMLNQKKVYTPNSQVSINIVNNKPLFVNSNVTATADQKRVRFGAIGSGNTNTNYEVAPTVNRRVYSTYTNGLEVLAVKPMGINLLEWVDVEFDIQTKKSPKQFNGVYLVTSKVIYIQSNNYYEKYELVTNTNTGN